MEFNAHPYDDYTPAPSRLKPRHFKKDEHVVLINIDRNMVATKARRAKARLQTLNANDQAEDVLQPESTPEAGQYKFAGTWYAITAETKGQWISGCEVRGVASRSLEAVERLGGWIAEGERRRILAGKGEEDVTVPFIQIEVGDVVEEEEEEEEEQEQDDVVAPVVAATAPASSRRRATASKRWQRDPQEDFYLTERESRSKRARPQDLEKSGSEIEVAQPPRKVSRKLFQTASGRRQRLLDFPHGLDEEPIAPVPIRDMGQYYWSGTWYAIVASDPAEWVNGRPVRKVPARHRAEVQRRGGIFDDAS